MSIIQYLKALAGKIFRPATIVTLSPSPVPDYSRGSPHFALSEFECRCGCGDSRVNPELLDVLEGIRAHFGGRAVRVVSGYRCPAHNKRIGGARRSQHLTGNAADIQIAGIKPALVANYAEFLVGNRGGVGRYKTFTHVDVRGHNARWNLS